MTAESIAHLEQQLARRERRQFRAAVLWGVAIVFLVFGVSYSIYSDFQQDSDIRAVGICASAPNSKECAENHAISVSKTTPAEACFILAQGGIQCKRPLDSAAAYQKSLLDNSGVSDEVYYEALPGGSTDSREAPDTPDYSAPDSSPGTASVPAPRPPSSPEPQPPKPEPTPQVPPVAPTPVQPEPAAKAPLMDTPDQLGLCVNALGLSVIC